MANENKIFLVKVAIGVFCYSICMMMSYQLWIIEYMSNTAVNGLLAGDPQYYHSIAVDMREKIISNGWQAWRLRPNGQGSAGILSVLYYFIGPYPWLVVFINSLCHSLASIFLILILNRVVPMKYALIASLYFIISPFEMHWFSQINKESFVILGVFGFIYGVVLFCERKSYSSLVGLCWMFVGAATISITRPYIVQILFAATVTLGLLIVLFSIKKKELRILGCFLILFAPLLSPFMSGAASDQTIASITFASTNAKYSKYSNWVKSDVLPRFIDEKLYSISYSRMPYELLNDSNNATVRALNLVNEAEFHSALDMIQYMPRALQVALLAPFPTDWPLFSSINDGSTFRLMLSVEMFMAYVCFIFLAFGLYRQMSLKFILPVLYMLIVLQIYGIAIPNIGVMFRYKYSYFIFLVSLGMAFFIKYWLERHDKILCADTDKDKET